MAPDDRNPHEATTPERIGSYKILRVLGEGGMGTVYLAVQTAPLRRQVALKVIKRGMDSKAVLARFEAERQALALMEHSSIASIFDAGSTDAGQPWFAMEWVKGIPITEYCDRNKLRLEDRILLFRQVCAGVHHAHLRGVIHRDLKPSNILVSDQDGNPRAKIIDFGLAKAVDHRLVEQTIFTEHGQIIGTPAYMSPEQAGLDGLDIDSRSDIYSLGILLYELLSGTLPFEPTELAEAGYLEIQRIIRETDAPRPSKKATTVGAKSSDIAARRQLNPAELSRKLRGDLDWILLKALEKDRTRRYATAVELVDDLLRYESSEPISAGPPSVTRSLIRIVRKHPGKILIAFSLLAIAFSAVAGLQNVFLRDALESAERALQQAARAESTASRSSLAAARASLQLGRWRTAIAQLDEAARNPASDPVEIALLRLEAAESLSQHSESSRVRTWLTTQTELGENSATVKLALGISAMSELPKAGAEMVRDALADANSDRINPADRAFATGILSGDLDSAIVAFELARSLNPHHIKSIRALGIAYFITGQFEETRAAAGELERRSSIGTESRALRVLASVEIDDHAAAVRAIRGVAGPRATKAKDLLDPVIRSKFICEWVTENPDFIQNSAATRLRRGLSLLSDDRTEGARLIQSALSDPKASQQIAPADRAHARGMIAEELEESIAEFEQALESNHQHPATLIPLGVLYILAGRANDALILAGDFDESPASHLIKGLALISVGRFKAAKLEIADLSGSKIQAAAPLASALCDLFDALEQEIGVLAVGAQRFIVNTNMPEAVFPSPPGVFIADDHPGNPLPTGLGQLVKVATAGIGIQQSADRGIEFSLPVWFHNNYPVASAADTMKLIWTLKAGGDSAVGAVELFPEALMRIASIVGSKERTIQEEWALLQPENMRAYRGMSANLPAVRRLQLTFRQTMNAACRMLGDFPEGQDDASLRRLAAADLAEVLEIRGTSEVEFLTHIMLAVNTELDERWLWSDRLLLRWRELHGATVTWHLTRAEILRIRGATPEAHTALERARELDPDHPWVAALTERLAQ